MQLQHHLLLLLPISTHAPARGRDSRSICPIFFPYDFNTRARKGARPRTSSRALLPLIFQHTRPQGGATPTSCAYSIYHPATSCNARSALRAKSRHFEYKFTVCGANVTAFLCELRFRTMAKSIHSDSYAGW